MKKILLPFLLLFAISTNAQQFLSLDYVTMYNSSIIKATWSNMTKMLFSEMTVFKATMTKYNYSLTTDGSAYIANTSVGSPFYTIAKSSDDINMIFTSDDGFTAAFRTEIRQKLKGGNVSFEQGYEVYRVQYQNEGFNYKIKIAIKQDQDGSGMVALMLQ